MSTYATCRQTITDISGNILAAATVWVYQPGTTTPVAGTMYSDNALTQALSNPLTSNSFGGVLFYMATNQYVDLAVSLAGYTSRTIPDCLVDNAVVVGGGVTTDTYANTDGTAGTAAHSDHHHAQSLSVTSATLGADVNMGGAPSGWVNALSITLPAAGTYMITAQIQLHSSSSGRTSVRIYDNTTATQLAAIEDQYANAEACEFLQCTVTTTGADAIHLDANTDSGGSTTVKAAIPLGGANNATQLIAVRMA